MHSNGFFLVWFTVHGLFFPSVGITGYGYITLGGFRLPGSFLFHDGMGWDGRASKHRWHGFMVYDMVFSVYVWIREQK